RFDQHRHGTPAELAERSLAIRGRAAQEISEQQKRVRPAILVPRQRAKSPAFAGQRVEYLPLFVSNLETPVAFLFHRDRQLFVGVGFIRGRVCFSVEVRLQFSVTELRVLASWSLVPEDDR